MTCTRALLDAARGGKVGDYIRAAVLARIKEEAS